MYIISILFSNHDNFIFCCYLTVSSRTNLQEKNFLFQNFYSTPSKTKKIKFVL